MSDWQAHAEQPGPVDERTTGSLSCRTCGAEIVSERLPDAVLRLKHRDDGSHIIERIR